MDDREVSRHVSRNDRDAESLWFLEGCRWNLTHSLMNSVRKVCTGIEGETWECCIFGKLEFYRMLELGVKISREFI